MKDVKFNPQYHHRILYELRSADGVTLRSGETGGKREWLDHKKFATQNAIKRVKSALRIMWSVKTEEIPSGDGAIRRAFEDGRVLTIWVLRDDTTATTPPPSSNRAAVPAAWAKMVADGLFQSDMAVRILKGQGIMTTVQAVEDAADLFSLGIYEDEAEVGNEVDTD